MVKQLHCGNFICVYRHLSQLLQCSVQMLLSCMCLSVGGNAIKHATVRCNVLLSSDMLTSFQCIGLVQPVRRSLQQFLT